VIKAGGSVLWDDLVSSGAEKWEISIESAKRYLAKMVSKVGLLERIPAWGGLTVRYRDSI